MKVLVTGGAGFIGSHLVEALVKHNHQVRVLDDLSAGTLRNLARVIRRIEFIRGDIRDRKVVRRATRSVHLIFHQAALRSVPESIKRPEEFHEVNATATLQLLQEAVRARVRRVIYASSSSVYGRSALPQREGMCPAPRSPYAVSKLAGETYCAMFSRLDELETVSLRYFNVFGPRQSLDNEYAVVIPRFVTCLLSHRPLPVHGDGFQTRDFTYVENVIQANVKAATAPRVSGEVFNIACGRQTSVRQLAQILIRHMGVKAAFHFTPPRPGDLPHSWADIEKAKRFLGYRVLVPLEKGLLSTGRWFAETQEAWQG